MKELQDMLMEMLDDYFNDAAVRLVVDKIEQQGVVLSARERAAVRRGFAAGTLDSLHFRRWKFWEPDKEISVEITAEDVACLERRLEALSESVTQAIMDDIDAPDGISNRTLANLKKRCAKEAGAQNKDYSRFHRGLRERWEPALDKLSMTITIASELSELCGRDLQSASTDKNKHLVAVITRLHARACQIAREILTLLNSGFADGAHARWRTLHEISVAALFVQARGDDMAERYLLHDAIESYRAATQYRAHADALGLEPMSQPEFDQLAHERAALIARFGKNFGGAYGWAAETPTEEPNFADIERKAGLEHWRPYYKLASHNVHSNPTGVFHRLGLRPEQDLLLTGPSVFGLADAGSPCAISLTQVSTVLCTLDPTLDSLVMLKVLSLASDETNSEFSEVESQIAKGEASS